MEDDKSSTDLLDPKTTVDSVRNEPKVKGASAKVDDKVEKSEEPVGDVDDELLDLLDSAMEDFDKEKDQIKSRDKHVENSSGCDSGQPGSRTDSTPATPPPSLADPFLGAMTEKNLEALTKQFEAMFGNAGTESSQQTTEPNSSGAEPDLADVLAKAAESLSQNVDNLENAEPELDFLRVAAQAAGGEMGGPPGPPGADPLMPFMQQMMESLLTKEVLYPSLNDVKQKYPDWLSEHRDSLPESEVLRYSRQLQIITNICTEYEAESESDSAEQKKQRTQRILPLVQQLQACGHPPDELVGDMGALDFGGGAGAMPPGMPSPDQCSLM